MISPPASGLVGLIVIDAAGDGADLIDAEIDQDATLSQLLRWLTAGVDRSDRCACSTTTPARRAVRRLARPLAAARVAADCRALGVQLERTARQLRRDLAAPPSPLAAGSTP